MATAMVGKWAVIKFVLEDTVEVVPTSWYVSQTQECFWPPRSTKKHAIIRLVKNRTPPESDWGVHPAKVMAYYDDLQTAERKANKATAASDLSSSQKDTYKGRGYRSHKRNKKYEDESSSDSNIASDSENSIISYPVLQSSQKEKSSSRIMKENHHNSMKGNTEAHEVEVQIHRESSPSKSSQTVLNGNMNPSSAIDCVSDNEPRDLGKDVNEKSCSCNNEFKKLLLDEINVLQFKVNSIMDALNSIMKVNKLEKIAEDPKEIRKFYGFLPLNNDVDVFKMEEWLSNTNNYNLLVAELSRIGGNSLAQSIRSILYRVFGNHVALEYSWEGAKKKKSFKSLIFARALLESMKIRFLDSTEHEAVAVVKVFLVKAKERITRCNKQEAAGQEQANQEHE